MSTSGWLISVKRVVVIGAGFGGLAVACLLQKDGFQVTVVEKNEGPGGRARLYKSKGFSFDMGPSWYLMPQVFVRFFKVFKKKPSDYYTLQRLDPSYRLFFGEKDLLDISKDKAKNRELFESIEPGAGARFDRYLQKAKYQYDTAMAGFIYREYKRLSDFFSLRLAKEGLRLNLFGSLDSYTRMFFSSDRLRKILEYTVVFLGGNPKNTPALYSLMSHVDFNLGVWYPKGGMNAVAKGMETLAKELGVEFFYDCPVDKVLVEQGVAVGVKAKGKVIDADLVVANADYHHAEQHLLEKSHRSYSGKYWRTRTMAPSGFIMYLGLDRKIDNLQHHTLFLEEDWQEHFDEIFNDPKWPKHPSFYVCVPSKTEPDVAPKGMENLFVLVPVASGLSDTSKTRRVMERLIFDRLKAMTGIDVQKHIVTKRLYAHKEFTQDYNAYKGTALGLAHTMLQTAIFRPRHRSKKIPNLYFTGQYTHPGVGVPMVIIASHIVAGEVVKDGY